MQQHPLVSLKQAVIYWLVPNRLTRGEAPIGQQHDIRVMTQQPTCFP